MRTPLLARTTLAVALAALFAARAHAVGSDAGGISLTFGPSARGEAMGGLYATEANDYAARWSNPGGLAFVESGVVGTVLTQLVPSLADDVYFMFGGWVTPTKSLGTLQFDVTYLTYGKSTAVSTTMQELGTFSSYEVSPSASLGFKFLPNLGLGLSVKYIRIDLAPDELLPDPSGSGSGSANSWAFDLGALYRASRFRIGTVVNNLGPDLTYIDNEQSDPLPRSLRVGFMYDIVQSEVSQLRSGFEVEQSLVRLSRKPVYHAGAEFVYLSTFSLRAGYLSDDEGAINDFAAGFGCTFGRLSIEYANIPQAEDLARPHRFAVWMRY